MSEERTTDPVLLRRTFARLLEKAVQPHAFNCGWRKSRTAIKMVPVGGCTCGIAEWLQKGSRHAK